MMMLGGEEEGAGMSVEEMMEVVDEATSSVGIAQHGGFHHQEVS